MKEELEGFLQKRLQRDMEIVGLKIEQAEQAVKDYIDVEEYARLVCSFRPGLITNSTDLAGQYQHLEGLKTPQRSARMQHLRYAKLGQLEAKVCGMHNQGFLEKEGSDLLPYLKAFNSLF
jgi:ribosomal protein S2